MVNIMQPTVVVIGGGTGSSIVLKGLKKYNLNLSTIVPMGDSGGSSGKLRKDMGVLSAGEIRQRLVALADEGTGLSEIVKLLDHRFENGGNFKGHNFGNIMIAGLTEYYNSQQKALEILSKILNIKGRILPSTWDRFELVAEYENGKKIIGEHFIDESSENSRIAHLYTEPKINANPEAIEAIKTADFIIFAPGDLYSSILHNLVIEGIPQAIRESRAKKILVCNLMTTEETVGMILQDLVDELEIYIGAKTIDMILVNSKELPEEIVKQYEASSQFPVKITLNDETKGRIKVIHNDLLAEELYKRSSSDELQRSLLRHSPEKLGALLASLIQGEF